MSLSFVEAFVLAAGLVALLVAGALLAWNFPDRLNRAYGLALVLFGLSRVTALVPDEAGVLHGFRALSGYAGIAAPFALVYVAAAYRDRYGRPGLRKVALPVLVVAALVVEWLYVEDYAVFSLSTPVGFGLYWLSIFGPSLLAALLAHDAAASDSSSRRHSLALASLGFAFLPTAYVLHLWIPGLMDVTRGITTLQATMMLATLLPLGYVVGRLALLSLRADDVGIRRGARTYLTVLASAPLTVVALTILRYTASFETTRNVMILIMVGWSLVGNLVVAYAIARHQVFGVERGVKLALRRGTVAAVFAAVFIIAAQFLQAYLDDFSWIWGGVGASLLLFAIRPLSRMGSRVADAAMPGVDNTPVYAAYRRLQMYESAHCRATGSGTPMWR